MIKMIYKSIILFFKKQLADVNNHPTFPSDDEDAEVEWREDKQDHDNMKSLAQEVEAILRKPSRPPVKP